MSGRALVLVAILLFAAGALAAYFIPIALYDVGPEDLIQVPDTIPGAGADGATAAAGGQASATSAPVQTRFQGFSESDLMGRRARVLLENTSGKPIRQMQTDLRYLDAQGQAFDTFPHTNSWQGTPFRPGETKTSNMGHKIPDRCARVEAVVESVTFADGTRWTRSGGMAAAPSGTPGTAPGGGMQFDPGQWQGQGQMQFRSSGQQMPAWFFGVVILVALIVTIPICVTFAKAGEAWWAPFIPIYNAIVLLRIVGKEWYWIFLMMIPCVNYIIFIYITYLLARSFTDNTGLAVLMTLLLILMAPVGWLLLAFGPFEYQGPAG
jgi:hypothetical protein